MTDFLGSKFVDKDGKELGRDKAIDGYKLIMIVYSASWWGGCQPFKANLKNYYNTWNKDGANNLQVVIVSGDQNPEGFKSTMDDAPWVALPFGADKSQYEAKIPCTGYPTPGVINGSTGAVIIADAFGKVTEGSLQEWLDKWTNQNDIIWFILSSSLMILNSIKNTWNFCD